MGVRPKNHRPLQTKGEPDPVPDNVRLAVKRGIREGYTREEVAEELNLTISELYGYMVRMAVKSEGRWDPDTMLNGKGQRLAGGVKSCTLQPGMMNFTDDNIKTDDKRGVKTW